MIIHADFETFEVQRWKPPNPWLCLTGRGEASRRPIGIATDGVRPRLVRDACCRGAVFERAPPHLPSPTVRNCKAAACSRFLTVDRPKIVDGCMKSKAG